MHRFCKQRIAQGNSIDIFKTVELQKRRGRDSLGLHDLLGHHFIKRDTERDRIGAYKGNLEHFQQSWNLRFASAPVIAFRNIEDYVDGVVGQPAKELFTVTDSNRLVSVCFDCVLESFDGGRRIEFRRRVQWVVFFRFVIGAKVIG